MTTAAAVRPLALIARSRTPNGTLLGIALVACANLLSLAGAARVVPVAFVGGAVVGAVALARTRPLIACEFALWLWLLGPQVRRMVDLSTGYHDPSPILLAAPLATLATLPYVRRLRRLGVRRAVRPLLIVTATIALGYIVGALRVGLQPASAALLGWLVPVLFGLQVVGVGDDAEDLRATVERVLVWATLIVGVYGVVQFYGAPAWDTYWMSNAPMNSIGSPEPFEIRVFSTLNSPGPLGVFLVASILYLTDARHWLRLPAQVAGYATLGLSLVRAAWLACLLGLVVVLLVGRARARTTVLITLAVVMVGVLQISGPLQTVINDRIDETLEGQQDDSFVARVALHRQLIPTLADDMAGQGLGATGTASMLANEEPGVPVNMDSGLLDFGLSLGLPGGLLALAALGVGGMQLSRAGMRNGMLSAGTVAGGLSVLVQMLFGNAIYGVGGITFFLLWGLAVRQVLAVDHLPASANGRMR